MREDEPFDREPQRASRGFDALFEAMRGLDTAPCESADELDDVADDRGVVTPEQFDELLRKELQDCAPVAPAEARPVKPEVQAEVDALAEAIRRSVGD